MLVSVCVCVCAISPRLSTQWMECFGDVNHRSQLSSCSHHLVPVRRAAHLPHAITYYRTAMKHNSSTDTPTIQTLQGYIIARRAAKR